MARRRSTFLSVVLALGALVACGGAVERSGWDLASAFEADVVRGGEWLVAEVADSAEIAAELDFRPSAPAPTVEMVDTGDVVYLVVWDDPCPPRVEITAGPLDDESIAVDVVIDQPAGGCDDLLVPWFVRLEPAAGWTIELGTVDPDGEAQESPPVTESETRLVVGQPADVEHLSAFVPADGVIGLVAWVTVPSECHEPQIGWEEPDADGVLYGRVESWWDPSRECEQSRRTSPVVVEIPVGDGEWLARVADVELAFRLPNGAIVDGPVLTSPLPTSLETEQMAAEVEGVVRIGGGCVTLGDIPIVWPAGASWDAGTSTVVLADGTSIVDGDLVYGAGGYPPAVSIVDLGYPDLAATAEGLAAAVADCVGPSGEVAWFNLGTIVERVVAGR